MGETVWNFPAKDKMKEAFLVLNLFFLSKSGTLRQDELQIDEAFNEFQKHTGFFEKTKDRSIDCSGYQVTINGPQGLGVIKGCGQDMVKGFEVFGMQLNDLHTPMEIGLTLAIDHENTKGRKSQDDMPNNLLEITDEVFAARVIGKMNEGRIYQGK